MTLERLAVLERLARLDEGEVHGFPEWEGWSCFTHIAVELEVAEFLWALVRALKPAIVVESGTGEGYATYALAAGCEANGRGIVYSYEPDPDLRDAARVLLKGLPVNVLPGDTLGYDGPTPELVFLDSGDPERGREVAKWGAVQKGWGRPPDEADASMTLVVHDANLPRDYELPEGGVILPTPRGLYLRT